jgi:hypothetical protein
MRKILALFFAAALALPVIGMTGCDQDEEVLDVETQQREVEVERDADTGALEVESEAK